MYYNYNKQNTSNARELRKNMTPEERHLWYDFLKRLPVTVHRQKNVGNYPAYHVFCWVIVAVVWLAAGSVVFHFGRDAWHDFSAYRAPYHIVKAKLRSVSYDEFQGMVWERRHGHYYREAIYRDEFCFDGMEGFPVSRSEAERASEGDEYLLVVFDKCPTKPVFIFSAEAYRWP